MDRFFDPGCLMSPDRKLPPRMILAPKRSRQGTSRARTGCSTCKARRVKCDEAKPVCQRCTVGGRKCQYVAVRPAPPRNVITVYLPPAQSQPTFFANDHGLDFFHQNIAAKLDGQFDSDFWSRLVLQLAHSETPIRHAVAAISVVYQDVESSLRHPAGYVHANLEAQREWSVAARSLSARIQAHPNSVLVPLVCCLLFTCIEFLRGRADAPMLHVRSGLNILAGLRHRSSDTAADRHDLQLIEHYIVPVFSRLNILCSLAGQRTPSICAPAAKDDSPQEDLDDARRQLIDILGACVRFIDNASRKTATFQIDVDDLAEQAKLQTRLDAWRCQLDHLLARMQIAGSPAKQDALHLLFVHYKVIYIWIRVCTTAGEMATDAYYADFAELVQYAEKIAKPGVETKTPQLLSFDIQILGPLYYTALKCRHPTIRRRALDMLQWAPRREGLWNARHAYVTAKRVIELEERQLNGQGFPDEASRLHGLPLPDEESRIDSLSEMPFDSYESGQGIVLSPDYPGTLEAVFWTKPWGLLGEWQTITEYIKP